MIIPDVDPIKKGIEMQRECWWKTQTLEEREKKIEKAV